MRDSASAATTLNAQPAMAALFISDLHLQPELPRTTQAFLHFLTRCASHSHQLYLLGDIFEAWAGDDDIADTYNQRIVAALKQCSEHGVKLFWIAGNRDFLVSKKFAEASGVTLLNDPHVTTIAGLSVVLTHGDAQCTDDHAYMQFRAQVRDPAWQAEFVALPLLQRKAMIASMRAGSRAAQRSKSDQIMDVNQDAITRLFNSSDANIMIHGHTHRPACHDETNGNTSRQRYVLSDWDLDEDAARGDWLAIDVSGNIQRIAATTLLKTKNHTKD